MIELGFSFLAGAISIALALSVAVIVGWLHLRASDTYGLTPRQVRGRRATAEVLTHLLWWGIVFPLAFIGILFPVIAVANIIWKFLP